MRSGRSPYLGTSPTGCQVEVAAKEEPQEDLEADEELLRRIREA